MRMIRINMVMSAFVFLAVIFGLSLYKWDTVLAKEPFKSGDQQLNNEKLRQEIVKLQIENQWNSSLLSKIPSYGTFITALVAIIGVIITIYKLSNERRLDREQREAESIRRLDDEFTTLVNKLGSKSEAIQASAAVSIQSFLKQEYKDFHRQVLLITLANLKIEHSKVIHNMLVDIFEKALRLHLKSSKEQEIHPLDLARAYLRRANLSHCDLSEVDLGFAEMKYSNLKSSNLFRAQGIEANLEKASFTKANMQEARFAKAICVEANFHETNLVSAVFKKANLKAAGFYRASMQSAHFEGAILLGAKFEQANISDAFFQGASFDEGALKSLLKTKDDSWKKAHFDKDIEMKLKELAR